MTYTFNSTEKTTKNNKDFDYTLNLDKYFSTYTKDTKGDYTSELLKKIRSIFPWAKDSKENTIIIDALPIESYNFIDISPETLNLEWNKAITRLYDYIYYSNNPSYDFKIGGMPVKLHGNYVQVGSHIVPKFTSSKFFNNIPKKDRIIIYQISMNINSIEIAA